MFIGLLTKLAVIWYIFSSIVVNMFIGLLAKQAVIWYVFSAIVVNMFIGLLAKQGQLFDTFSQQLVVYMLSGLCILQTCVLCLLYHVHFASVHCLTSICMSVSFACFCYYVLCTFNITSQCTIFTSLNLSEMYKRFSFIFTEVFWPLGIFW